MAIPQTSNPKPRYRIRLESVTKRFGSLTIVDNLSLQIEAGELVVLLGPSGCGKTTTLRMLAGLEDISSGDIFIGSQRVNEIPAQHRDVAMVFQNYALYPHMSVFENISYPLRVRKLSRAEIKPKVDRVAALLGIAALLGRQPRELSGGERQRVALARAIVRQPKAFLMDEPLSNLDAKLRVQMRGELKRLQHELGTTTLYVTHDQAEAMTLADRVAVMQDGRLQQFDVPLNVYDCPATRFVAEFVGSPSMNFIEGWIEAGKFTNGHISVVLTDAELSALENNSADRVTLGIRPEHVQVSNLETEGWLRGRIYVTELMGNETLVFLEVRDERIVARAPADFRAEVDATAWLSLDSGHVRLFRAQSGEAIR